MTDDSQDPNEKPPEPSVLDYLKSRLSFGRRLPVEIPAHEPPEPVSEPAITEPLTAGPSETSQASMAESAAGGDEGVVATGAPAVAEAPLASAEVAAPEVLAPAAPRTAAVAGVVAGIPWRSIAALAFALLGQNLFEPPGHSAVSGAMAYAVALGFLFWAAIRGEWSVGGHPEVREGSDPLTYRRLGFFLSLPLAVLAFLALSDNLFTTFNVALWLGALILLVSSLWLRDPDRPSLWRRIAAFVSRPRWEIHVDRWTLLVLAAAALVIFFRLYHLQQTPAEPFSDHAEKLLDVYDVSQGQTRIFFPRNTGREAIQMYWTLLISWIFGTGLSFFSLKLGTALIGLFTLPYVYLLGKEVGGSRVGLLALVLTGIAYWPNVISRVGLRFALYPMFVAPMMFHLVRGLRARQRNDFILAGIFLGLGLHGYSPYRIVPFLVVVAFALYLLHAQSSGARRSAVVWFVIVAVVSLIVFLPLLRYATENPDAFSRRALTRLSGTEQPLPGPWYQILISNTWNALRMFNWDNGLIWVHSIPNRPAMDVVTAALFLIGVVLLARRYARHRHWLDLFLLLSIPVLLLPSILSLAFPGENPSLNRTAGALVPAFVIASLALDGFISAFGSGNRRVLGGLLTAILLWGSASQNYDLVFHQYDHNFRLNAWNSSEMGALIRQFGDLNGETDTVWVVPFPHWVDTRLVGVWAGIPNRDFGKWADQLPETLPYVGPKLFMAKADTENPEFNDQHAIDVLKSLYPQGSLSLHRSTVPGRDFWIYFVPSASTQ